MNGCNCSKPGFNSVFIVRYLLEKCKDVADAMQTIKNIPIASNCNILMIDVKGNMVVAECSPSKIYYRYPEKVGNKKFVITVNHFSSDVMRNYNAYPGENEYFSHERYTTAYNAFKNTNINNDITFAKDLLSGKLGFMCQYSKNMNFDTIWSSIFDLTNNDVYIAEGNPKRKKYIVDDRFKKWIKNTN